MIKKIIFILCIIALCSCGESVDKRFGKFSDTICPKLMKDLSSKTIIEANKMFSQEFSKEIKENSPELSKLYKKLNHCFLVSGYSRELSSLSARPITGNGTEYYTLKDSNLKFSIMGFDKPALSVKLQFSSKKPLADTNEVEVIASLRFYDSSKILLKEYNLYPTPDFVKTLIKGKGEFLFIASLDVIWDTESSKPFENAAAIMSNIENTVYYELNINVMNKTMKKNEHEQNKEYQDMIDKIKIN